MTIPPATERLRFREWEVADVEAFHAICSDPDVMQFVGNGVSWSWEQTEQFVLRNCEMSRSLGFCQWPVISKEDGTLIGFCGFVPADQGAEIGWRLAKAYWGRGLATEAARVVLKHGFETLGFQHIIATVQSSNRASIRVVEKLGMHAEGCFSRHGREILQFAICGSSSDHA